MDENIKTLLKLCEDQIKFNEFILERFIKLEQHIKEIQNKINSLSK